MFVGQQDQRIDQRGHRNVVIGWQLVHQVVFGRVECFTPLGSRVSNPGFYTRVLSRSVHLSLHLLPREVGNRFHHIWGTSPGMNIFPHRRILHRRQLFCCLTLSYSCFTPWCEVIRPASLRQAVSQIRKPLRQETNLQGTDDFTMYMLVEKIDKCFHGAWCKTVYGSIRCYNP